MNINEISTGIYYLEIETKNETKFVNIKKE
jgi:hypothetical protein